MSSIYQAALQSVGEPRTYAMRLSTTLRSHGISHSQLALKAGVCPTQLSRWMAGRSVPSLESMLKMNEALDRVLEGG